MYCQGTPAHGCMHASPQIKFWALHPSQKYTQSIILYILYTCILYICILYIICILYLYIHMWKRNGRSTYYYVGGANEWEGERMHGRVRYGWQLILILGWQQGYAVCGENVAEAFNLRHIPHARYWCIWPWVILTIWTEFPLYWLT